jgi:hypothetical protein
MLDDLTGNTLKKCLQEILANENLAAQRSLITAIVSDLNIDGLDCASALLHLLQAGKSKSITVAEQKTSNPVLPAVSQSNIKMVRYRLAVGSKHQINVEILKKVLVEESGVDKNNICNVNIQDLYTLIDLPDEMPLDIFQHLKLVEINQQKLDIRRVKTRNHKKRGNHHHRRGRQTVKTSGQVVSS